MIEEMGTVVSVDATHAWVESVQKSSCQNCALKSGCGQAVMGRWAQRSTRLPVLLNGENTANIATGDQVRFGVAGSVVANGSLLVYLIPLLGLIMGTGAGQALESSEVISVLGGLVGFLAGGAIVRRHAYKTRHNTRLQPVLLDAVPKSIATSSTRPNL